MRILFLNAWHSVRKNEVAEFIKEQKDITDVFCFQEAFENTKEIGNELLGNYQLFTATKRLCKEEDYNLATYIKNTIEVIDVKTILPESVTEGLGLNATINYANTIYNICNVHGKSRPGDKLDDKYRLIQSKALIDFFKDSKHYTVIGGDFNLEKNTDSIKMFSVSGYADLINMHKIKTTRNRLAWDRYPDNKQYYSDYVFVNHGLKAVNFEVLNNEISDHLPLIVEF